MNRILSLVRRCVEDYDMISPGERVAVGVSGGKDSLVLLAGLAQLSTFYPGGFSVEAFTVDMGTPGLDLSPLDAWCRDRGIPFHRIPTQMYHVIFETRQEKNPCALCAKFRRGALNDYAHAHGCNLVALGHNRDDVIETFFMSLLYESRLNTFGPVTYLDRQQVSVIRPLIFLPEKYALSVAKRLELPIRKPNCPVAGHTKREEMKDIIRYFTKLMPDADERIMNAIADTHKYGMWDRLKLPPWNDEPIGIELFKDGKGHEDTL